MGCAASRIDNEEVVRICKERKRLMKQLLGYRKEFSDAQVAYLRSLRNTGVTLRQFTESDSLELEETNSNFGFPPSPPPPLPPSPPPPPTFSPDLQKIEDRPNESQPDIDQTIETDEESGNTPPPLILTSSLDYWDPFGFTLPQCEKSLGMDEQLEEENWADTNTEFLEEDRESVSDAVDDDGVILIPKQRPDVRIVDDSSSMMSSVDMSMVVWRSKKTLARVVKDLDEYFLRASAVVKDIAVFIDIEAGGTFVYQSVKENKRKRINSAKVFSALMWNWSSRSLQSAKGIKDLPGSEEPCKPGAHCITLQKLYSEEQKLYKDVKLLKARLTTSRIISTKVGDLRTSRRLKPDEEMAKVEYSRKSLLLQRQEEEHDWAKAERTRSACENLESYILSLQESIRKSSSTILTLIKKELHPQLITLASGLMHMWQTMRNCHQVQNHISHQLNRLTTDEEKAEPTSESHQQAAAQLQTEVTSWYHSFCKLVEFQREYVRVLCMWSELTCYLEDVDGSQNGGLSTMHSLTKKWKQALDKLPDKVVSEAIKCLLSAVHSIIVQQQEECNMRKRSERLGRKLERELALLSEVEMKHGGSFPLQDANFVLTSNHPLTIRRAKVEALRILVDDEQVKYTTSFRTTRAMVLNNLQTSLPKVFQALTVFSSAYAHSFEGILCDTTESECEDVQQRPPSNGI
ncbi:hypothetical protein OROGR_000932 [Orobanche gracilis]